MGHIRTWKRSKERRRLTSTRQWAGRGARVLVSFVVLVLLLAACSDEGQQRVDEALENVSTTAPTDAEAPADAEPAPEPEPAPETEPETPPSEPETPTAEDSGLSNSDWVLLILLAIAAVALIAASISAAGRYSASKAARKNAVATRIGDIVGSCRWIHDSGSMEVLLVQSPLQVQSAWAPVRTRMMDTESQIATLAANTGDPDLQHALHDLGQSVTALRSAEEAYVTAKTRATGVDGDELLQSSHQAVIDRRRDLQMSLQPLAANVTYR